MVHALATAWALAPAVPNAFATASAAAWALAVPPADHQHGSNQVRGARRGVGGSLPRPEAQLVPQNLCCSPYGERMLLPQQLQQHD